MSRVLGYLLFFVFVGVQLQAVEITSDGKCAIEGKTYPAIGFGTYPLKDQLCANSLEQAAIAGARIIDTATMYQNFLPIGAVLNRLGRENFYLISKVWHDSQAPDKLRQDLMQTLEQLNMDHIDAYLLHWPNSQISIEATLLTMERLRREGYFRHIGLSNVTANHMRRILEFHVPITWVQVEMHPLFLDQELLTLCQDNGITVQAWAPLARGRVSRDPLLKKLGKKYGKSPSQVALRWIVQHGALPLPSSTQLGHVRENMDIGDFTLTQDEMAEIDAQAVVGERKRLVGGRGFGFEDEFDFTYEQCWPN